MSDIERLAVAVGDRRAYLRKSQGEIAARAGVSSRTVSNIERAANRRPHPITLAALDRGLEWEPGSARRLLTEGIDPGEQTPAPVANSHAWSGALRRLDLVALNDVGATFRTGEEEVGRYLLVQMDRDSFDELGRPGYLNVAVSAADQLASAGAR